jgi:outer membrane protein assembly factor BamA
MIFERNTSQNYFGIGEAAQKLSFPGAKGNFQSFDAYSDAESKVQGDGKSYTLYDKMLFQRPIWLMSLERSLLGGVMRSLFGFGFSDVSLGDYTGKTADSVDVTGKMVQAPTETTRFHDDCAAHRIVGCRGGWDNTLRLGLALDTRDFEPDPNSGFFGDIAADFGTHLLGSQYDYSRVMLALRGYVSPVPSYADLVLAARGVYEVQSQGAPFFSMNVFPFTEDPRTGMGGLRTLRGYRDNRFVGHVMALTNYEVRWTFTQFRAFDQRFALIAVPFLDMGRAFDAVRLTSLTHWNRNEGLGLRIAWNLSTIIMVDYGVSEEDTGLYINFTHIF